LHRMSNYLRMQIHRFRGGNGLWSLDFPLFQTLLDHLAALRDTHMAAYSQTPLYVGIFGPLPRCFFASTSSILRPHNEVK
jgi:hypothetical protein